jgi:hypothetical protein
VARSNRNFRLIRVDLTRSLRGPCMTAVCANRTAGVDVNRPLRTAATLSATSPCHSHFANGNRVHPLRPPCLSIVSMLQTVLLNRSTSKNFWTFPVGVRGKAQSGSRSCAVS